MIFPPILIFLDASHATIRNRATVILSNILERIDNPILAKTGLAEVVWTVIFPNLSTLPPITDLDESVALLTVTYTALISLARLWYPSLQKRAALLDKVVRDGFVFAMMFQADKLKVVEVELQSLNLLISEMDIYFVKHLKVLCVCSVLISVHNTNHLIYPSESTWKQSSSTITACPSNPGKDNQCLFA